MTHSEDKLHTSRDFHILFVPRRSMLCEQRLKEQGVLGSFINIDEYILDLIPCDSDLLSMEYESAFRVHFTWLANQTFFFFFFNIPRISTPMMWIWFLFVFAGVLLRKWPNKPLSHS